MKEEEAEPPEVVTTTLTLPELAEDGVVQVINTAEFTVQVAVLAPNFTVPVLKLVPLIWTLVPPDMLPEVGLRLEMVGAGVI